MSAAALYDAGKLAEAIDAQLAAVRQAPTDEGKRVFLFELLAFAGDLDRAARQLQAVAADDPKKSTVQASYMVLLDAERKRRDVMAGKGVPRYFGPPPAHVALRLEAIAQLAQGDAAGAAASLQKAAEQTPTLQGTLNGKPISPLIDADERFGTVLEVMAHGDYYWVPLEQVESLALNPPKYPRDLLYAPARLSLRDNASGDVFLPALYPGSHESSDEALKLGRSTDWLPDGRGVGTRLFLAGDDPVSIAEWRQLELDPV